MKSDSHKCPACKRTAQTTRKGRAPICSRCGARMVPNA